MAKILIVDDEPRIRDLIREHLQYAGFTCEEAGDGTAALSVLSLEILPLRRHRGDILGWTDLYLDEWQEKYKRYVSLTQGAWQYLREYEWPGNLDQLYSVCERLVLLTQKRNIDEIFLREQLEQMAPRLLPGTEQVVLYQDRRAVELAALMKKHKGNRQKVAE